MGSSADRTHNLVNEWKRLIATVNHSSLPDVPFCHTLAIGKASFSMDARRTSSIGIKVALTIACLDFLLLRGSAASRVVVGNADLSPNKGN